MAFFRTDSRAPVTAGIPRWPLILLAALPACLMVAPQASWDLPVAHTLPDGTRVTRDARSHLHGWPLDWLYWSRPSWTSTRGSATAPADDTQIDAFTVQESVDWPNFRLTCGLDRSLFALATRQVRAQLEAHPRVSVVAISWASLGADAFAGSLLPCVALYLCACYDRRRFRSRQDEGRCVACGYNLRGNISGRCPECGRPIDRRTEGERAPERIRRAVGVG